MNLHLPSGREIDFSYCMNIHPGDALGAVVESIHQHVPRVRNLLVRKGRMGLGLRISDAASRTLAEPHELEAFQEVLDREELYAFTINGFPYGAFHNTRVKENVYAPDWQHPQRLEYTLRLLDLLVRLRNPGEQGSISTVPITYKPWGLNAIGRSRAVQHLMEAVLHAVQLEATTGVLLHLGLEPEPDCLLETCDETLRFFTEVLLGQGIPKLRALDGADAATAESWIRRHLGVCLDTCHAAVLFEDPTENLRRYAAAGIRVSKIQVSAALSLRGADRSPLLPFVDPVYLHQVKGRKPDGSLMAWPDLSDFLADEADDGDGDLRVHFHVPLHWDPTGPLQSTAATMTPDFWMAVDESDCRHVEVETYTFDVLPEALRDDSVETNILRECEWAIARLRRI